MLSLSILLFLILLSGFFSGSETSLMAINRYRLHHLVRKKNPTAKRVNQVLMRPDRILGVILIGNTFANVLASAIFTMLSVRWFGEVGVLWATTLLTLIILIFSEIMPKTVAALFPQRVAFLAIFPLWILLKIFRPLVFLITGIANTLLSFLFGIQVKRKKLEPLSRNELQTILTSMGDKVSSNQQNRLLSVLDLEEMTVNDIMIPLEEAVSIDIKENIACLLKTLSCLSYTHILVYKGSIENVLGFLNARDVLRLLLNHKLSKKRILDALEKIHYIPVGTRLSIQLSNFQTDGYKVGLVVDEYGDMKGIVSVSDILEEIVGQFDTEASDINKAFPRRKDGSHVVDGNMPVRDLNRIMQWNLPTEIPANTLSGLIIEQLETIPEGPVSLKLEAYIIEVLQVENNRVVRAKIWPLTIANSDENATTPTA